MHPKFLEAAESLHASFEKLVAIEPYTLGNLPKNMPLSGVYLFSELGKHFYVGRSQNLRRRYGLHTRPSAQTNQASFAFLLAREKFGLDKASYTQGPLSRKGLSENENFMKLFHDAKVRVRRMDYRFVDEDIPVRQTLLEIYCSVALSTPFNKFDTH
ncbi:MAG: hypothetical protein V3U96_13415 [Paracoccaceae bacterium]